MEHPRIDEERILDRYLAGQLSAEDEEAFELHLFECASCLQHVQAGEDLRRGLQGVAAEDMAAAQTAVAAGWFAWFRRRPAYLAAAAGLALALLTMPIALIRQQSELERLLSAAGVAGPSEPIGDIAVISIGVERSTEPVTIRHQAEQRLRLLSLELPSNPVPAYDVTLSDAEGKALWTGEKLQPTLYDTLLLALPSSYLPVGSYQLTVRESVVESSPTSQIALRVVANDS